MSDDNTFASVQFTGQDDSPPAEQRPDWLPEKFWTDGKADYEGLARSYGALESKLGAPKEEAPETPPAEATEQATEQLEAKGISYADLQAEFMRDGALSDGSYQALERAGFSKADVDSFIASQQQAAQFVRSQALEGVGEERFSEIAEWAEQAMTPADLRAYNAAITAAEASGSVDDIRAAVANLVARYEQVNGVEPAVIVAGKGTTSGAAYADLSEFYADLSDPKYDQSPAFRQKVQDRLARSRI